jgi:hypothetical protein
VLRQRAQIYGSTTRPDRACRSIGLTKTLGQHNLAARREYESGPEYAAEVAARLAVAPRSVCQIAELHTTVSTSSATC